MPHALSAAVARVGRAALPDPDEVADGRLLARFVASRDEAAFAELVRRVGPTVLGACRRVSGDHHLAEDAFQAAFLVLARKAADVRPREAVRGWLYGVAVRCAQKARTMSARRRHREAPVPTLHEHPAEPADRPEADALAALDEEVAALPEHLRVAVVLCELECVARKEAAARLGVPEGTLSSRLAKARKVLAVRLKRRGVAISAALAVVGQAAATVPPRLVNQTAQIATVSGPVSPAVATLSNGVIRAMFFQKLKLAAAGGALLAVALLVAGLPDLAAQEPPPVKPAGAKADAKPPAKPAGPGKLLVGREGACWVVTPDGKKLPDLPLPDKARSRGHAALSPDGTRAAFVINAEAGPRPPARVGEVPQPWPFQVVVRKLDKPDEGKEWDLPATDLDLRWSADGKAIVLAKVTSWDPPTYEAHQLDPETGKTEKLDLPENAKVLDCGRDGKTFLVEWRDPATKKKHLALAAIGDKEVRPLTELSGHAGSFAGRISPDGKAVLFTDGDPERKDAHKWGRSHRPYLLDVATKKREPLADYPENAVCEGVAWSPDGKKVAYTWKQLHPELLKKDSIGADEATIETEAFVIVADADGKNAKTVVSDKGPYATNMILNMIDWR